MIVLSLTFKRYGSLRNYTNGVTYTSLLIVKSRLNNTVGARIPNIRIPNPFENQTF